MVGEKNFQPPVEPIDIESTEGKKEETIEPKEESKEDITPDKEVDPQEEKKDKGTEEERKVELSEKFEMIKQIIDTQKISEENKEYFLGSESGDGVFEELQNYISDCLQKGAPADEIEEKLNLFEYGVGELLKDDSNKEECDKRLVQFIQGRIDHFVATFDQRIEAMKKSVGLELQEEDIKLLKVRINNILKRADENKKIIRDFKKTGKKPVKGSAKLLMHTADEMSSLVEVGDRARYLLGIYNLLNHLKFF